MKIDLNNLRVGAPKKLAESLDRFDEQLKIHRPGNLYLDRERMEMALKLAKKKEPDAKHPEIVFRGLPVVEART